MDEVKNTRITIKQGTLLRLWRAANTHSVVMSGEALVENEDHEDACDIPMPDDAQEVLDKVIDYLEETI